MEKEMRELYIEGVAIHGGPEPCAVVCEGGGEASVGVRVGWAMEPRNWLPSRSDALTTGGRRYRRRRYREPSGRISRGPRTCAYAESSCARTGRSHGHPLVVMVGRVVRARL